MPSRPGVEPKRLRAALEVTLRALREAECLEAKDALLVALCRTAADRGESKREDARQWVRLLVQLNLQLLGQAPPVDDGFTALLLAASSPAPPGRLG